MIPLKSFIFITLRDENIPQRKSNIDVCVKASEIIKLQCNNEGDFFVIYLLRKKDY